MSSAGTRGQRFTRIGDIPPLRADPFEPDVHDALRAEYVMGLWHEQDDRLRQRDRQVEENVRMLLGQHWTVWSDLRQKFVDLSEHLNDDEKRWRHMPVLNQIFRWWVLTHARMNENPPVIVWQPGPDRIDAELAEVMDPIFKYWWREVGMLEVIDRLTSWMLPGGRAHLKSRIDAMKGMPIQAIDRATLRLLNAQGQPILDASGEPIEREIDDVPLDEQGAPRARLLQEEGGQVLEEGEPHVFYEGGLDVDVLTCLEARGEWGEHIPWHKKAYHIQRSFLSPLQAYEAFGVELDPDITGEETSDSTGIFMRLLYGSGLFGAAEGRRGAILETAAQGRDFVSVYELWQKPTRMPGTQRIPGGSPGGRLCVVAGSKKVLRDGPRTHPFKYTSPIRCFDFYNLPGRPQGTSGQEMLNGPVRSRNRLHAQGIQHATIVANPIQVIDLDSGLRDGDVKNVPGFQVYASRKGSAAPLIEFVHPGRLGPEVYESADRLADEIEQLGHMGGQEGRSPTADASGELVKELRFNADRPLADPMRRMVIELARLGEDWRVMTPSVFDVEKTIQVVGDDNIARTITVYPALFEEGTVNAEPDVESMLPEGRGERQNRVWRFWQSGVWGDPMAPEAINTFLEQARFPHMGRASRPGGPDRATAEQNVGKLLTGTPAVAVPIFEWYDHVLHQSVLERFMKSPEYLKIAPPVMQEMVLYRQRLIVAGQEAMLLGAERQMAVQAPVQAAAAATAAEIQGQTEQIMGPGSEQLSPEQVA
jgi:hypothetical protein